LQHAQAGLTSPWELEQSALGRATAAAEDDVAQPSQHLRLLSNACAEEGRVRRSRKVQPAAALVAQHVSLLIPSQNFDSAR
jgi:hypothetical protein